MVTELTAYIGRSVYSAKGAYVGHVANVIVDLPSKAVSGLLLTRTNENLVDGGRDVAVPYRWVSAVGDIVLLSTFPERVAVVEEPVEHEEPVEA